MKKFAWSSIAVLLLGLAAVAQHQPPTIAAKPDTVYVGADGKFEAAPDTALVQFNIGAQEPVLKDAYARANNAAEQIRQVLRANGIDPKQAEIGFFQVTPVFDWRNPKRKLLGYRVGSSITLKLKDFSKIGAISEKFADMDVTENQNISYTLEDLEQAKIRAVEDAFKKARNSAEAVAKAGGRALAELSYASVDTYEHVQPMMMRGAATMAMKAADGAAEAAPPAEFTPQKVTITAHVNALFGLK